MTSDNQQRPPRPMSRRALLYGGAATVAAVAGGRLLGSRLDAPAPTTVRPAAAVVPPVTEVHFAATDGWVSMPAGARQNLPFWPDSLAPSPFDLYVFGFRDVTGLDDATVKAQRGKAQISAPLLAFDQGTDIKLTLTNLGLSQRPDLVDGHTVHWHGFQNAIPLFDGVPELSISVPIGRDFTYFYRPHEAGTYMYHCHFEDVEHVQMGMTGVVFVRPAQNKAPVGGDPLGTKYAYNDGDGSTRYTREFAFMLTEIWAEAHYRDAHIQTTDWTDFSPSFWTMNGRCYPDTLAPNGNPLTTAAGRLQYQPNSSLITANEGDRVLLRLANLGYQNHSLTADGITLTTVAKDAAPLVGRDGSKHYLAGNSVEIGPGESRDVLFTAPSPGTYLLYDRDYGFLNNGGGGGYGGQLTEIRVSPAGTLGPQTTPNT
ncbi:multicopper oxidase domain-containing protein [Amycolatopsis sp. NPDC049252]|uniref:multicopper oxidase domain-containing protein n=1 Tax=Amycolatopsis sp. NPDC049252 TaxID=3363933 RepID=UPI0037209EEA